MGYTTTTWGRNSTRHVPVKEQQLVFSYRLWWCGLQTGLKGMHVCKRRVEGGCLIACARYKRYMGTGFIGESRSSMFIEEVRDSVL